MNVGAVSMTAQCPDRKVGRGASDRGSRRGGAAGRDGRRTPGPFSGRRVRLGSLAVSETWKASAADGELIAYQVVAMVVRSRRRARCRSTSPSTVHCPSSRPTARRGGPTPYPHRLYEETQHSKLVSWASRNVTFRESLGECHHLLRKSASPVLVLPMRCQVLVGDGGSAMSPLNPVSAANAACGAGTRASTAQFRRISSASCTRTCGNAVGCHQRQPGEPLVTLGSDTPRMGVVVDWA